MLRGMLALVSGKEYAPTKKMPRSIPRPGHEMKVYSSFVWSEEAYQSTVAILVSKQAAPIELFIKHKAKGQRPISI